MTASLHLVAGTAAGIVVQGCLLPTPGLLKKVFWAFAAGVLSHILFDAFPHQEYLLKDLGLWAIILAETGLIFILIFTSVGDFDNSVIIFFAMVGGALPDLFKLSYVYFIKQEWLAVLSVIMHLKIHGMIPLDLEISFWWQSLITVILVLFVRLKSAG